MNRGANGLLLEEHISETAGVAYFEGATEAPGVLEADQWLRAIETDSEPLVMFPSCHAILSLDGCVRKCTIL